MVKQNDMHVQGQHCLISQPQRGKEKFFLSPALTCLASQLCHLSCRYGEEALQCQQSLNQQPENSWMGVSGHTFWLGIGTKVGSRESYVDPRHSFLTALLSHLMVSRANLSCHFSVQNSLPITSRIKPNSLA